MSDQHPNHDANGYNYFWQQFLGGGGGVTVPMSFIHSITVSNFDTVNSVTVSMFDGTSAADPLVDIFVVQPGQTVTVMQQVCMSFKRSLRLRFTGSGTDSRVGVRGAVVA